MSITYSDVVKYHGQIRPQVTYDLRMIEDALIERRDNENAPIYLTKWRVKSINSIYLKTKRKNKSSLEEITDYGGLRVLCLCQQDIPCVHKNIMEILKSLTFSLTEFMVFNWHDAEAEKALTQITKDVFPGVSEEIINKKSGYKSIHYVAKSERASIEIQLRTLLQDVWGELEHSLSYKQGNIHPHIVTSFRLLSEDLGTNDALIKHLRDIRDGENAIETFSLRHEGPFGVLGYEDRFLPTIFAEKAELGQAVKNYDEHVKTQRTESNKEQWIENAEELYTQVRGLMSHLESDNAKYWLDMEEAFLNFAKGEHNQAKLKYESILGEHEDFYVPHFRLGEIHFIQGDIEKALVEFDRSEELLLNSQDNIQENIYRVKVKLALIYWLMGAEYYDISHQEIKEAEKIFLANEGAFSDKDERNLYNNLCWYSLECWLKAKKSTLPKEKKDVLLNETKEYFAKIEGFIDTERSSNALDTAAWFCFQLYKDTGDSQYLEKARKYCEESVRKTNFATNKLKSIAIQRSHIQAIMFET